ncbi:MAG TPA: glutathione S-transferase N-terminal domain-containing protein [Steroidobacteraceae bacterium]|nr:glutathione S-transferase N-terminal domain-containing protein [Steroidobacteraceae bacterium]
MIDVYGMSSPNVVKVTIMLEELGLPYRQHHVNVFAGEQHAPQFLRQSPNNKVPLIVDEDGPEGTPLPVFESGAILLYLAEKTGQLLPRAGAARTVVLEWLMVQVASVGPMFGQLVHFTRYAPAGNDYSLARYTSEVRRIFGVLERRLAASACLGGADYSVADVATWPWIRTAATIYPFLTAAAQSGDALREWPALGRWFATVGARAAVQRGVASGERFLDRDRAAFGAADPEAFDRFFNRGKFQR